jgi:hypothetical protein
MHLMASPPTEHMKDGNPMGAGGFGEAWVKTMSDPRAFRIIHNVDRAGCCWYPNLSCAKGQKARSYLVISENFIHGNDSFPICCCRWCLRDVPYTMFYDRQPFAETSCERLCQSVLGGGDFVTEHDLCYCCYVIPCMPLYDILYRPCVGGYVARTSSHRSKELCFLLETRCCSWNASPIMSFLGDSVKAKDAMSIELGMFRKNGGGAWAFAG